MTGCGSEDNEGFVKGARSQSFLEGVWEIDCMINEDGDSSSSGRYEFRGNRIYLDARYFSDTSCSYQQIGLDIEATFSLGREVILNSGEAAIRLVSQPISAQLAYIESSHISALNERNICGYSNWSSGNYKEIINCEYFSELVDGFEKDIIKVDEDSLYFGDSDFLDSSGYPTRLESIFATKVE